MKFQPPKPGFHEIHMVYSGAMSMKMGMRQMTRFSMVSSNWDDSFRSQHLPSAIYALAETARGEVALCSHPRRSTFTVRRSVNVAVNGLKPT